MDRLFGGMLGDVGLELEGHEFGPGSVVQGRFAFRLHRPKECRRACVQLRADEEWMGYPREFGHHHHHDEDHHHHHHERRLERQTRQIFEQTVVLSGQGNYQQGIHPFRLQIPHNAPPSQNAQNFSGAGFGEMMMNAAFDYALDSHHSYAPNRSSSIEWSVRGWLDIPWGSDPVAREVILVSPYAPRYQAVPPPVQAAPPPPAPRPTPSPQQSAARFCMKCGTQARKAGARFCHACGNTLV
ncbi:zinc ribbon domain-containing protein [bacterium]|nr:zinc ribbon domain-containing protein [bacterium]